MTIRAFQIGENFDLDSIKKVFTGKILYQDADSVLYQNDNGKYIYVFKFGAICFCGYKSDEMTNYLSIISHSCSGIINDKLSEDYEIEIKDNVLKISFDKIKIPKIDDDTVALIMLNLVQSVTLDHYLQKTEQLLSDIQKYARELEKYGKIKVSEKKLRQFIGKSLILKNVISENLYIFDTPPKAWENEDLKRLNDELKKVFSLQARTKNIQEDISIIKENLDFFVNFTNNRKLFLLECIVVTIMIIEVIKALFL